jgi:hypothetical protein
LFQNQGHVLKRRNISVQSKCTNTKVRFCFMLIWVSLWELPEIVAYRGYMQSEQLHRPYTTARQLAWWFSLHPKMVNTFQIHG